MIFDKADQFSLVVKVSAKMEAYALRGVAFEAVIQALVVTVIEPLLLEFPLEVPISLSNKKEIRPSFLQGGNHINPVLCCRRCTSAVAPGSFEDCVDDKHRHVATYAVALVGEIREGPDHRLPESRLKGIQLQHVWPGGKQGSRPCANTFPAVSTNDAGSVLASSLFP